MWVMLVGAVLLLPPLLFKGTGGNWDSRDVGLALLMGVAYAGGVGGLFKAFSLAPVSVASPFTAGYPALVVLWGIWNGLTPTAFEWLAILLVLIGVAVVARTGPQDGGLNAVPKHQWPALFTACAVACLGYASSILLGQAAAVGIGEMETTFISRFPAALLLWPFAKREKPAAARLISPTVWRGILIMAALDVLAVSAINASGHFPAKEFAAMGISAYGAIAVVLAMVFLKERVSVGQGLGIALIVSGVGILGWPK
jgi:drug/metabolite transporter (DMT)-like permease